MAVCGGTSPLGDQEDGAAAKWSLLLVCPVASILYVWWRLVHPSHPYISLLTTIPAGNF